MANTNPVPHLNFIAQHRTDLEQLRLRDKKILLVAVGFFGLSLAVTLFFIGWLLFSTQKFKTVQQQQQQLEQQLTELSTDQAKFLVLRSRLDYLAKILPTLKSHRRSLEFLSSIAGPNIQVSNVSRDPSGVLEFNALTYTYFSFEQFINTIRSPEVLEQMDLFTMDAVNRNQKGQYTFNVALNLVEETGI